MWSLTGLPDPAALRQLATSRFMVMDAPCAETHTQIDG